MLNNNDGLLESFCIDLKIDKNGQLKILEFGHIDYSNFLGNQFLHGFDNPFQELIVNYLACFGVEIFGNGLFPNPKEIEPHSTVIQRVLPFETKIDSLPDNYEKILSVLKPEGDYDFSKYAKAPNNILVMNSNADFAFARDVKLLNTFYFDGIENYTPKTKRYYIDEEYNYLNEVEKDFKDNNGLLVIKSAANCCGLGQKIVSKDKIIDSLFKNISNFYYDDNKHFIIQEFVKGKEIKFDSKTYDPTMRVVCLIWKNNKNEIKAKTFEKYAYWKLPEKSQEEKGSYKEKFVSSIKEKKKYFKKVSKTDAKFIKQELEYVLPLFFKNLLNFEKTNKYTAAKLDVFWTDFILDAKYEEQKTL